MLHLTFRPNYIENDAKNHYEKIVNKYITYEFLLDVHEHIYHYTLPVYFPVIRKFLVQGAQMI